MHAPDVRAPLKPTGEPRGRECATFRKTRSTRRHCGHTGRAAHKREGEGERLHLSMCRVRFKNGHSEKDIRRKPDKDGGKH